MHHTARLLLPYVLAASSTGRCKAEAAGITDQIMTACGPCINIVAAKCLITNSCQWVTLLTLFQPKASKHPALCLPLYTALHC